MCTVSVILTRVSGSREPGSCIRVVTSRDELRSRPLAVGAAWRAVASDSGANLRAIYPIDPAGGGTWVAASESGLVLCLLNANPLPAPPIPTGALRSRGKIIPTLIDSNGPAEAIDRVRSLDLDRFAPFRLLAVGLPTARLSGRVPSFCAMEATWDRTSVSVLEHRAGHLCLVSSGLGDPLVKPRLALFDKMLRPLADGLRSAEAAGVQDRFHRHTWADRPEISVLMSRLDARTVSITTVEVEAGEGAPRIAMRYEPIPDLPAVKTVTRPRTSRAAASGRHA